MSLDFLPISPLVLIWFVFVVSISITVFLYLRKIKDDRRTIVTLLIIRSITLFLILTLLLGMTISFLSKQSERKPLIVILDKSPSMNYKSESKDNSGNTRMEIATGLLKDISNGSKKYGIETVLIGSDGSLIDPASIGKEGITTNSEQLRPLYSDVNDILSYYWTSQASFIFITDCGLSPNDFEYFLKLPPDLYIMPVGESPRQDIALIGLLLPDPTLLSIDQVAKVYGVYYGDEPASFSIRLYQGKDILTEVPQRLAGGGFFEVSVPFRAKGTAEVFSAQVVYDRDTISDDNNVVSATKVIPRNIRILVVSSSPSPDYALIKRSLERDEALDISTYCTTPVGELVREETTVDIKGAEGMLSEYDAIIIVGDPRKFGDFYNNIDNLCKDKGVGLVYFAQDGVSLDLPSSPLSVGGSEEDVKLRCPELRSDNPYFFSDIRALDGMPALGSNRVVVKSWAYGFLYDDKGHVRLAGGRYSSGTSYALAFWGLWRMPFETRGEKLESFISSLARISAYSHLQGRPYIEISKKEPSTGESVEFLVPSPENVPVRYSIYRIYEGGEEVITGGEMPFISDGHRTSFVPDRAGVYRIEVSSGGESNSAYFVCKGNLDTDPGSKLNILKTLLGDKRLINKDNLELLLNEIKGKSVYTRSIFNSVSLTTSPWLYLAIVLSLLSEWYFRRRYGLP